MVRYTFTLKESYIPGLTRISENDALYGGIRLLYVIHKEYYTHIFGQPRVYFKHKLGTKLFLRPYKKYWDKRRCRLPYVYWGKQTHPLTRLWVILSGDTPIGTTKFIPETTLQHQTVKLFGNIFISKDLTVNLFKKVNKFSIPKLLNNQKDEQKI